MIRKRDGLTLVELVIVMLLIGILLIAIFSPEHEEPIELTALFSSLNQLHNDIRYARNRAIAKEHYFRIDLDFANKDYDLSEADPPALSWSPVKSDIALLGSTAFKSTDLQDNVLIFDKTGKPHEGDQPPAATLLNPLTSEKKIELEISSPNVTESGKITIEPVTGFSRIEP